MHQNCSEYCLTVCIWMHCNVELKKVGLEIIETYILVSCDTVVREIHVSLRLFLSSQVVDYQTVRSLLVLFCICVSYWWDYLLGLLLFQRSYFWFALPFPLSVRSFSSAVPSLIFNLFYSFFWQLFQVNTSYIQKLSCKRKTNAGNFFIALIYSVLHINYYK